MTTLGLRRSNWEYLNPVNLFKYMYEIHLALSESCYIHGIDTI